VLAHALKRLRRVGLRGDVAHRQDIVDRPPVGVLANAVAMIVHRLARRAPAGHDTHSIDVNLAPVSARRGVHILHVLGRFF